MEKIYIIVVIVDNIDIKKNTFNSLTALLFPGEENVQFGFINGSRWYWTI